MWLVVDVVVVVGAVVVLVVVVVVFPQEDKQDGSGTIKQLNANHAIFLRISFSPFFYLYILEIFYQYIPYVLFCQSAFIKHLIELLSGFLFS